MLGFPCQISISKNVGLQFQQLVEVMHCKPSSLYGIRKHRVSILCIAGALAYTVYSTVRRSHCRNQWSWRKSFSRIAIAVFIKDDTHPLGGLLFLTSLEILPGGFIRRRHWYHGRGSETLMLTLRHCPSLVITDIFTSSSTCARR